MLRLDPILCYSRSERGGGGVVLTADGEGEAVLAGMFVAG
jgi:hypothetical protein